MYSVREVAKQLGVSLAVIYRLIENGDLKAHRIGLGRGTIRISESQLSDYLHSSEIQQTASKSERRGLRHLSY